MDPFASTPWPMILTPQCSQVGASAWIAHSKLSNTCGWSPGRVTLKALSYSLPHTSHLATFYLLSIDNQFDKVIPRVPRSLTFQPAESIVRVHIIGSGLPRKGSAASVQPIREEEVDAATDPSSEGLVVSRMGLRGMGTGEFYGTGEEEGSIAAILRAVGLGVTFLDT